MLGSGYVIDHCIAVFSLSERERVYRAYVADALKAISENTSRYIVPGYNDVIKFGAFMSTRWIDLDGRFDSPELARAKEAMAEQAKMAKERKKEETVADPDFCETFVAQMWERIRKSNTDNNDKKNNTG